MSRRKRAPRKKKKSSAGQNPPADFDRRSMESLMADVGRLLESQEFESIDEINAFLNQYLASGEPIPAAIPETPLQQAQSLMYEAWEARGRRRIKLAKEALTISQDCADAYVLLAEEAAKSREEALRYYEQGVQAGERAIGKEMFAEGQGHFWGILETRPYMRARAGLAQLLWVMGRRDEAIGHLEAMLTLNPGDNQGNRYSLANWLLAEQRYRPLNELLGAYEDDIAAAWAYTRALLTFQQSGATPEAARLLQEAISTNPHVPDFLLGRRHLPRRMPEYVGLGDENEAIDYAASARQLWREVEGALTWLEAVDSEEAIVPPRIFEDETSFEVGDSVVMKEGIHLAGHEIDVSGWQGRVVGLDESGFVDVLWDSQTLREIPESLVQEAVEDGMDWLTVSTEPEMLSMTSPRDDLEDWEAVAQERFAAYGIDLYDVLPELAETDFLDEMFEEFPPFELEQFLADWEIPKKEHGSFRRSLGVGLGKYYHDIYGYYKYGKQPGFLIDERMHEPYIFGYGALEILGHKSISRNSKLKVCQHLFETMNPVRENGVPYGLVSALGYLATENELTPGYFLLGMMAVEYRIPGLFRRPVWMEGATRKALIALADWLTDQEEMAAEEKLWWIWQMSVHCQEQPHIGKAFALHWLGKEEIPAEQKRELCWAWLTDEEEGVGRPPLIWRVMRAYQVGDQEQVKQLLQEAEVDPDRFPWLALEELPPAVDEEELDPLFQLMRDMPRFIMVPGYLRRLAIPALVRFGEELDGVVDLFWDNKREYYIDAMNNGIADAIQEFHQRLPAEELRRLVERGINYSRATTRKTYYALSTQFYGQTYLEQALNDNAKSVRNWAQKKLQRS